MSTTVEEFASEVEALIGDYAAFVADLLDQLEKLEVETKSYHITHLLYRTETAPEYERLRDALRPLCREAVETEFNGRPVSVMTMRHPLELPGGHSVTMIELPAPRAAHTYPSGLESIGVLVGEELPEFKKRYAKAITGVKDHGRDCKPGFITFDNGKTAKFYDTSLREVVILEGWRFEEPLEPEDAEVNRIARMVNAWRRYLYSIDNQWQPLIQGVTPKPTGCGPVYEVPNPIPRPGESFAIADMREGGITDAHYHHKMTEVYMVLEGSGTVVVGGEELPVRQNATVVIPPDHAHFTVSRGLVLATINTPPFEANDYLVLNDSNGAVRFDEAQYERLTKGL